MDRTSNNGLGLILVIDRKNAAGAQQELKDMGEKSFLIGDIRSGSHGAIISA
jgi:phosphoribosylaminoimidazole (AIR) synthetase